MFQWDSPGFHELDWVVSGFLWFGEVSFGAIRFYWGFIGFRSESCGLTGLFQVLPSFTVFFWVLLFFYWVFTSFH